jgi:hypothetical protein
MFTFYISFKDHLFLLIFFTSSRTFFAKNFPFPLLSSRQEPVSSAAATTAAVGATATPQIGPTTQQPPPDTSETAGPNLDDYAGECDEGDTLRTKLRATKLSVFFHFPLSLIFNLEVI